MGARHQAFLIARVATQTGGNAFRYRCVGAIHHQYCYAERPLHAAHRLKRLAEQKDNASLILEDLRRYSERNQEDPEHPCPYAEWILLNAFSKANIDGDDHISEAHIIEANLECRVHGRCRP
jgi:hypothetical protein